MNEKSHIKMRKKSNKQKNNNGTIMQTISFHYKNKKNKDSKITSNIMSAKPTSLCLSLKFSELNSRTNLKRTTEEWGAVVETRLGKMRIQETQKQARNKGKIKGKARNR